LKEGNEESTLVDKLFLALTMTCTCLLVWSFAILFPAFSPLGEERAFAMETSVPRPGLHISKMAVARKMRHQRTGAPDRQ
jgi:hypothetical protein